MTMNREPTLLDDFVAGEADTVTFPVARALLPGETLLGPVSITCTWLQGAADAAASQRVSGAYQVVAGDVVQLVSGAVPDAWYLLRGVFPLSSGRVLVGRGIFRGRA